MSAVTHHLIARGVDEFTQRVRNVQHGPEVVTISPAAYIGFALTTAIFFLAAAAIRYAYGEVVATLSMIEIPRSTAIIRTSPADDSSDEPDAPLLSDSEKKTPTTTEHELLIVKSKPLTSNFRLIISHLVQRTGSRWSRYRGAHVHFAYNILFHFLAAVLTSILPFSRRSLPGRSFVHVLVSIGLCRVSLLWNHVVISEPSKRSLFRRFASRQTARKIVLPTAFLAVAEQAALLIPAISLQSLRVPFAAGHGPNPMTQEQQVVFLIQVGMFLASGLACFVCIYLPAKIAFTRVQASLLSAEEEPIVPFDRTFGGRVNLDGAVSLDGEDKDGVNGKLAMREAWKSFDWNSRVRVFKVYAKTALLQLSLVLGWIALMGVQLRYAVGTDRFDEGFDTFVQMARRQ